MIKGPWERSVSAATDRFGISMLGALNSERSDPEAAIPQYQTIIEEAKEVRHLSLLVPAYLRLAELLIRQGRTQEAQQTIEQFENRFAPNKGGPHFPTERQRRFMFMIKSRLTSASRKLHAAASSSR
jgi:ribonuclease D